MWLKTAILLTFAALLASLASGLFFLMKDQGSTRRTLHSLGVRITLAGIMMGLVGYGLAAGKLRSQAPWTAELQRIQEAGEPQPSQNVDEQEQAHPDDVDKVPVPG